MDQKPVNARLWRRLAATWIDSLVVYAVASFLIAVTAAASVRVSIEPLYVLLAAAYGAALLAWRGQTVGKALLGVAVVDKTGGVPSLRAALIREALGKWGIAVVAPAILGRALVGQGWVPTVYDVLLLLPVSLSLLIYYLIAKRTWYDRLAGTAVVRTSAPGFRAWPAFLALIGAAILGAGVKAAEYAQYDYVPCRLAVYRSMSSTEPYVEFLERGHASPVDYVIGLFDRYDVVVLCERLHPEASQWNFIYDVVRDPRFIERVGHIFTEYGHVGMQAYLDDFMSTEGLDTSEVNRRAVHIMRNMPIWPAWTNTNLYTYLTRLYALNQSLPADERIRHHLTDAAVDWSEVITEEDYQAYRRTLWDRDEDMARTVIDEMERLTVSADVRPKGLVIMNTRHAYDLTGRSPDARRRNTYEYIKDALGERSANVLLNQSILISMPIAGGLWEVAFNETGHVPAGFDLDGSPFGEDPFDLFPFFPAARARLRFRDVFTGFAYTHPWEAQYTQSGTPRMYEGFEQEVLRRARLVSEHNVRAHEACIKAEREGQVPRTQELPGRKFEILIELVLLCLNGVGLPIGIAAFATFQLRARSKGIAA